jgi:diphthamide biosynthesis enzyme Dph1/Dph2-like protein
MKTLFISVKINSEININKIQSLKLPKNIAIAYSIQYKEISLKIHKLLSKNHKIVLITQVLGCSRPKFPKDTQAILLISSGKFHAISLAAETNLPVYILESDNLTRISKEEIESFQRRKKASYLKFLNSKKIGILVSTKPGQENLKKALSLKLKDKNFYLFISNEINTKEFENFGISSFINTACPRLDLDSSIINISDLDFRHAKKSL